MDLSRLIKNPAQLLASHDKWLFQLAYPLNKKEYDAAAAGLQKINAFLTHKSGLNNYRFLKTLSGTGLPATATICSFSFSVSKWLVQNFPDDTEIDSSSAGAEDIRLLFRQILPATEYESISSGEFSLTSRIKKLKGRSAGSALGWLIRHIDASAFTEIDKESFFNSLKIFIRWHIRHPVYNRTSLQGIKADPFYHRALQGKTNVQELILKKLPAPKKLNANEVTHLINAARCTLTFLCRETEPFTYANEKEVFFFELDRGLSIALYGMTPERRLSVESYIGYLVFKNGVPAAYGGGWIFGHRCQFGINILPPFRGGESALMFHQLLRVYKQYYHIDRFVVKPYQFGKNNKEALQSGAFWFYHKAGFRPEDETLNELVIAERQKKIHDRQYRTPVQVLKKFTRSDLQLELKPGAVPRFDPSLLSIKITAFINQNYDGDRKKAIKECLLKTKKQLGIRSLKGRTRYEKKALAEWSLLAQASLQIDRWNMKEKTKFTRLIWLKGSAPERKFIMSLQCHHRFWKDPDIF